MNEEINPEMNEEGKLSLQLYVSGMSPKSVDAIRNLKTICDRHLKDAFELEIIDIYKHPEVALEQDIVFSPSLVKQFPLPKKVLVGTLENSEKVLRTLGITIDQPE